MSSAKNPKSDQYKQSFIPKPDAIYSANYFGMAGFVCKKEDKRKPKRKNK